MYLTRRQNKPPAFTDHGCASVTRVSRPIPVLWISPSAFDNRRFKRRISGKTSNCADKITYLGVFQPANHIGLVCYLSVFCQTFKRSGTSDWWVHFFLEQVKVMPPIIRKYSTGCDPNHRGGEAVDVICQTVRFMKGNYRVQQTSVFTYCDHRVRTIKGPSHSTMASLESTFRRNVRSKSNLMSPSIVVNLIRSRYGDSNRTGAFLR